MNVTQKQQQVPAFIYANSFEKLIREPHRRSATACRAPGLIWHFGFWPERGHDPQDARTRGDFNNRLTDWIVGQLAPFVDRLHAAGSTGYPGKPPNLRLRDRDEDGKEKQIYTASRTDVEFRLPWNGFDIGVRIELHADYVTVTFFTSVEEASYATSFKSEVIRWFEKASGADAEEARAASDYLHDGFWKAFVSHLVSKNGARPARGPDKGPTASAGLLRRLFGKASLRPERSEAGAFAPGEVFLDVRGVLLQVAETNDGFIPFLRSMGTAEALANSKLDGKIAARLLKQHEHFLSHGGFDTDPREYVANLFLEERALFISNLGSEPPRGEPGNRDRFIRYQVFVKQAKSRELGRLVERINTLETLKIMSLKDVELIREVGTSIRLQGSKLDKISAKLNNVRAEKPKGARKLERALCDLEAQLDTMSGLPTGGLAYRVVRSDYYGDQFKRRLKTMEAKPLEFWQSYAMFAERRYYSVLDYIANTGRRIRNLRNRLAATLETIQTTILVDLTRSVHRVQASTQLQAALLFVIGFSTFFGELLEPVYKFGRDNRELFEVMTSSIAWALSYLPGDVDIDQRIRATYDVLNRECLPTRAALETTNAILGDLEKYLAADKTANDEKCQAFFKVIGYVYGLAGSFAFLAVIFIRSIVSWLWGIWLDLRSLFGLK